MLGLALAGRVFAQQVMDEAGGNRIKTPQELFNERHLSPAEVDALVDRAIQQMQFDRDESTRHQAIDSLIPVGPWAAKAIPLLVEYIERGEWAGNAMEALQAMGDAAAPAYVQLLASPNPRRRQSIAATRLAPPLTSPELFDAYERVLHDKYWCVRSEAVWGLVGYGSKAVPILKSAYLEDSAPAVRSNALFGLAAIRPIGRDVAQLFVAALSDPATDVRVAAVVAMNNPDPPDDAYVPALVQASSDPSMQVRESVAGSLANIAPRVPAQFQQATAALRKLEEDPSESARRWAVLGIQRLHLLPLKPKHPLEFTGSQQQTTEFDRDCFGKQP